MDNANERRAVHAARLKKKNIENIFKKMTIHGITLKDLEGYTPEATLRERMLERRRVMLHKEKARESLKKAREAKKQKEAN